VRRESESNPLRAFLKNQSFNRSLKNYLYVAAAALKTSLKCSFITYKFRFLACFRLASAALNPFFNSLLNKSRRKQKMLTSHMIDMQGNIFFE